VLLSDLSLSDLTGRLKGQRLFLRTGPFVLQVGTDVDTVLQGIRKLYADFPLAESNCFTDFHVNLLSSPRWLRWIRPQVSFYFDGGRPFNPLPLDQGFAMFEWCFNWCITTCMNQYLIIHGAAVERGSYAAILPGPPGSGKSTLCAALVNRGWRLLTDELVLVSLQTNRIVPLARPIALKNASIELIQRWVPTAVFGQQCQATLKGRVAHLRPPRQSVLRMDEPAIPAWVIFPKYSEEETAVARPVTKAKALMRCAASAFNYTILGSKGFEILSTIMEDTDSYDFAYADLEHALDWFNNLKPSVNLNTGSFFPEVT
jgi:HprK-related kinase A